MARGQSLQDPFLNTLRKERVPVSIYLVNGIKLQGQIDSFDQFVVLLKNSVSQMVYKHAISTVVPARAFACRRARKKARSRPSAQRMSDGRPVDGVGRLFERPRSGERALLVRIGLGGPPGKDELSEFEALARSAGADVLARDHRHSRARRIRGCTSAAARRKRSAGSCRRRGADLVVFDHPLSPSQERNLEALLKCRVLDRTGLILDIFAQRARSFEGQLQVELAQLKHLATRLVRGWTHLERQKGGIGLRGPGETQLETDRRLLAQSHQDAERTSRQSAHAARDDAARAQARRDSHGRAGRLHERRQVDAVQSSHGRRRVRRRSAVRDAGSDGAPAGTARCALRVAGGHRRVRSRSAARAGRRVPLDAAGSARGDVAAARHRCGRSESQRAHRAGQHGARAKSAPARCRRSKCSTRRT